MNDKQTTQKEAREGGYIWIIIGVLVVAALLVSFLITDESTSDPDTPTDTTPELTDEQQNHIDEKSDMIRVDQPEPLAEVSSPLSISGEARGMWFFEADFPVRIVDADGSELGEHYAITSGEWMTEEFVPFTAELDFEAPTTDTGTLILERANPSGLEENADELRIPILFGDEVATGDDETRMVELYYYSEEADTDEEGNIMCSEDGLVAVEREIPVTQTPLQDTLRLLLEGELTEDEIDRGITTEFPLSGFELDGVSSDNGSYTLAFSDPNNESSGGSCRAGLLWMQIRETALQFDTVEEVEFEPEELFQP